jgi:Integrase core domain
VLDRHGLVTSMGRRRSRAEGTPLSQGLHPNDLWCTDYKGEFQLSDKRYCYPLTVTDYSSRYLLLCEALESNREDLAFPAFERLFHERGLPRAIRSDNGVPFASPHGLFQLSKLSVWWLRLGISIERIQPGHHEGMHLTLKKEATRPAGANILQQQAEFDAFLEQFNHERPHEALAMKCPAEVYSTSPVLIAASQNLITHFTTARSWSPVAVAFAGTTMKINLCVSWQDRPSASKKSTLASGWSVLWITISAILIWRKKPSSPWRTPSGQNCNPCLRNVTYVSGTDQG